MDNGSQFDSIVPKYERINYKQNPVMLVGDLVRPEHYLCYAMTLNLHMKINEFHDGGYRKDTLLACVSANVIIEFIL